MIPASDGAGIIVAVGPGVKRFKAGDDVVSLFNQGYIAGALTPPLLAAGTGGAVDGVLRQFAVWSEENLVASPQNLDLKEASTLSCAALTAWNALYGIEGRQLRNGQTVLTQGTGGVSIFALQFAKAAGARVIATTSSAKKAKALKDLGADHVINYKEDTNWGETAQKLSPNGYGVDFVVEVGGPETMKQSLIAIKREGIITIIGFLAGRAGSEQPGFLDVLTHGCVVRGVLVGSRIQFEEMNAAIECANIKPVVDEKVFPFERLQEAYQYMVGFAPHSKAWAHC